MHPLIPTHVADQAHAAARELHDNMRRVGPTRGMRFVYIRPSPRLRALIQRITGRVLAGRTRFCRHLRPDAPQPTRLTAWAPDVICCGAPDCPDAPTPLDPADPADRTCDLCGTHTPDGVHPSVIQVGAIALAYGACPDCHADITTTPEEAPPL